MIFWFQEAIGTTLQTTEDEKTNFHATCAITRGTKVEQDACKYNIDYKERDDLYYRTGYIINIPRITGRVSSTIWENRWLKSSEEWKLWQATTKVSKESGIEYAHATLMLLLASSYFCSHLITVIHVEFSHRQMTCMSVKPEAEGM